MPVKKPTERSRQPKRREKTPATQNDEFEYEETQYIYESIYGVRYPRQVMVASLANAPVVG